MILGFWPGAVKGWSTAGHSRIGHLAQSLLKGKHREEARQLLAGDPSEFANWEATMLEERPSTAPLHWHRQAEDWSCESGLGDVHCGPGEVEENSLLCVLAFTFNKYSHDAVLRDFPTAKDPLLQQSAGSSAAFHWDHYILDHHFQGLFSTASAEVRWLVTLLGDLHQPLHMRQQHAYGKNIRVTFRGKPSTLLEFWEDYLPLQLLPPPPTMELQSEYSQAIPHWVRVAPEELFREWARESAELACREIYGAQELETALSAGASEPVTISEELFQWWRKLATDRTKLASQRIAFVLLDLLERRKHREALAVGRTVTTRHRGYHGHSWWNFYKNMGTAAVVVPVVLLVLNWHSRSCIGEGKRREASMSPKQV